MTVMTPTELEIWAKILTGRDRRGNIELLNMAEKRVRELDGEFVRLRGQMSLLQSQINALQDQLKITAEDLDMWNEVLQMSNGDRNVVVSTARPVPERIEPAKPEAPVLVAAGPVSRPLNFADMLVTTEAPVVVKDPKPKRRSRGADHKPRRRNGKLLNQYPSLEDFAAWYNLVFEEFGGYPPDTLSMQYFGISHKGALVVRNNAYEAGLITHRPNRSNKMSYGPRALTMEAIENRLGKYGR